MLFRWLLLAAAVALLAMFSSFLMAAFGAACLALAFRPLTRRIEARFGRTIAASAAALIALICISIPITTIGSFAAPQAVQGLAVLDTLRSSDWIHSPEVQAFLGDIDTTVRKIPGLEGGLRQIASSAAGMAGTAVRTALAGGVGLAGGALNAILQMVIVLLLIFTFTAHAGAIHRFGRALLPLPGGVFDRCITAFRGAVVGVLAGVVLVAAIQGLLCGISFAVAGVPQSAFWGFLAAIVAPIPMIGTAMVWMPVCIWLWFAVSKASAVGLLLWCVVVVSGSDNILRPLFLKGGIEAPIAIIFLAIICGLAAFGPMGLLIGPVLLALGLQLSREGLALAPAADNAEAEPGNTPAETGESNKA